jgi:polysaccharide export outer membrane protein
MIRFNTRNKIGRTVILSLTLASSLLVQSCMHPRAKVTQIPVSPQVLQSSIRFRKVYVFEPGDTVEIAVTKVPEVSRTVIVRPDGFIALPVVNDVKAAGKTPDELRLELTGLFSKRLLNPEVAVIPTQVRQAMVYVTGEVGQASVAVPYRDAPTALQAITMAGGYRRSAALRSVAIIRLGEDGYLRITVIDLPDKTQPGAYAGLAATPLMPDDILFVPESGRGQVNRFINDFVTQPLLAVDLAIGTYTNFKLVQYINKIY